MAVTTANPGDLITAALWNELAGLVNGTIGSGEPVLFTDLSNASAWALTVRNQGSGGQALRIQNAAGSDVVTIKDSINTIVATTDIQGHLTVGGETNPPPITQAIMAVADTVTAATAIPLYGATVEPTFQPAIAGNTAHCLYLNPQLKGTEGVTTFTLTFLAGMGVNPVIQANYDANITDVYGVYVINLIDNGGGTITNQYGYWTDVQSSGPATNNWAYYGAGTASSSLGGSLFLGGTTNANMTLGLTINQAANDNEILALKSSDVAHGMTTITETDTFGFFTKYAANDGGLRVRGLADTGLIGLNLDAMVPTGDTTKSTAASAPVWISSKLKSGTGVTDLGANANLVIFSNNATTRFILDADGDSHQDVGTAWTNFDDHDDVALLNTLADAVARPGDPIREEFHRFLLDEREALERAKLVTFNEDGHHFVNMSRLLMLAVGGIRQLGLKTADLEGRMLALQGG